MGLSTLWITVMVPGIIESVQIVIWANEWIVPRAQREFPHLEMVMCGSSFHCLAQGGMGGAGGSYCKMGKRCPTMYVTVSFITGVMMKLLCPRGLK